MAQQQSWVKKSKLGTRILVAILLGPVVLGSAYVGKLAWLVVVTIIVLADVVEYYRLAARKGTSAISPVGILASLGLLWGFYTSDWRLALGSVAFLVAVTALVQIFRGPENSIDEMAVTVFGPLYTGGLLGHLILIRELPNAIDLPYRAAGLWIVGLILVVWICDTAAFFGGSSFGRRKLAAKVSPNKTWEGAAAGFAFAIGSAFLLKPLFFPELRCVDVLVLGAIVGIFGQSSDLTESLLKRDVGVKDSSGLIPGHGGMLDRFDSFFLIAPALYWYLTLVAF